MGDTDFCIMIIYGLVFINALTMVISDHADLIATRFTLPFMIRR